MSLPSGTVSFLFTDVEGSTRFWERDADGMRSALARHDSVLKRAVEANGGALFKKTGDGICAAFARASQAAAAALAAQRDITSWSSESLPVRMAVYTGPAHESEGDYVGPTLNRTARMLATGHGGQVLLSQTTRDLILDALPGGASLFDLGSHYLKDLERPEQIFQLLHPDLPSEFPLLNSLSAFRHNLPIQLNRLIGRERESREVADMLAKHRLVTITGSGGAGKTRLALHVAADLIDQYRDGAWFVDLAPANNGSDVVQAAASALGLREEPGIDLTETLRKYLSTRGLLLILDNCEQAVEACAEFARGLLESCQQLRILATSREFLGVPGEVRWRIPFLSVPQGDEPESESVRLFVDRAALCSPGFALTPDNSRVVAGICRRLDGIPLAIELAAARTSSLAVQEIEERLSERILRQSSRAAVPRHQTLRAVMDWSYDLLTDQERALLRRLSVFVGGFTMEAAELVTSDPHDSAEPLAPEDVLDLLTRLIEKSLVTKDDSGESSRFWMLQMLREFSSGLLNEPESAALKDRHSSYFLQVAEKFEAEITGPRQAEWLKRIEKEHDNLIAALEWCRQNPRHREMGLLIAGNLSRFWQIRGHFSEGRRHFSAMIASAAGGDPSRGWGMAHNGAGILAWALGDFNSARRHYEIGLETWRNLGDLRRVGASLSNLGLLEIQEDDFDAAEATLNESLSIREEVGDLAGIAGSLNNLHYLALLRKEFAVARQYIERGLGLFREVGDNYSVAGGLNNLGELQMALHDPESARPLFEESLEIYRALGDRMNCSIVLCNFGDAMVACERQDLARPMYAEALAIARDLGDEVGAQVAEEGLAQLDSWDRGDDVNTS